MTTKSLLILILAMFAMGAAFAQTEGAQEEIPAEAQSETEMSAADETAAETDQPKIKKPMNTITLDIGPLINGAISSAMAPAMMGGGDSDVDAPDSSSSSFTFGFALQYERQITDRFSASGRFSYVGSNMEIKTGLSDDIDGALSLGYNSFSIEGHARLYPWAKTFFLDGMLGFAHLSVDLSANTINTRTRERDSIDINLTRGYFKLGGRLGWRIDFGKPGGFVLEPSLGLAGGIGFGDSILKQFGKKSADLTGEPMEVDETLDAVSSWIIEPLLIDAGPSFALTFGWRF
jgi:hypothetical protein